MAYLKAIPQHICPTCKRPATVELFNRHNAPCGYFCKTHGKQREKSMTETEQAQRPPCDHKFIDSKQCVKCGWSLEQGGPMGGA